MAELFPACLDLSLLSSQVNIVEGAVTMGSVPRRTVFELRQFDWLFIFDNQWKWRNSGTIVRGTDPSAPAPW